MAETENEYWLRLKRERKCRSLVCFVNVKCDCLTEWLSKCDGYVYVEMRLI